MDCGQEETKRDIVKFDEFEDHKENIKPLKQGRNPFTLREIFHTDSSSLSSFKTRSFELEQKRKEWEIFILEQHQSTTHISEDPLKIWLQYVSWLENIYNINSQANRVVLQVLEQCIQQFMKEPFFSLVKNDSRFVKQILLRYISQLSNTQQILDCFQFMYKNHIGRKEIKFYYEWCLALEELREYESALQVMEQAIQNMKQFADITEQETMQDESDKMNSSSENQIMLKQMNRFYYNLKYRMDQVKKKQQEQKEEEEKWNQIQELHQQEFGSIQQAQSQSTRNILGNLDIQAARKPLGSTISGIQIVRKPIIPVAAINSSKTSSVRICNPINKSLKRSFDTFTQQQFVPDHVTPLKPNSNNNNRFVIFEENENMNPSTTHYPTQQTFFSNQQNIEVNRIKQVPLERVNKENNFITSSGWNEHQIAMPQKPQKQVSKFEIFTDEDLAHNNTQYAPSRIASNRVLAERR